MARRKPNGKAGRGITNYNLTANRQVARLIATPVVTFPTNTYPDARFHRPDWRSAPPIARNVNATRLVAADRFGDAVRRQTKAAIRFHIPESVVVCVRRKQRKEVLHAFNKTGKGPGRKPRRTPLSQISCKR